MLLQHLTQLRLLCPLWTSILQSDVRIKSAISNAAEAAHQILGTQPSTVTLNWMPTVTQTGLQEQTSEDSEGVMLEDDLEDEIAGLIDSDSTVEDATAEVVWTLPVCGCPRTSAFIN